LKAIYRYPEHKLAKFEYFRSCFSPHTIWVIKSRRMTWMGRVAHIGDTTCSVLVRKLKARRILESFIHG